MIESLKIHGFQRHRRLVIDFDPHVTTIVGATDTGKSAVIRALYFVAMNRPNGIAFIHHDEELAKVSVSLDGRSIRRVRGKTRNEYIVDGHTLKAFNTEVPEEITKLFNVTDINFQQQHDGPFWFSNTAGDVSRKLNAIIDLSAIDTTLGFLSGRLKETTAKLSLSGDRLKQAQQRRSDLKPIRDADADLVAIEQHAQTLDKTSANARRIDDLLQNGVRVGGKAQNAGECESDGLQIVAMGDTWTKQAQQIARLDSLIDDAVQATHEADADVPDTAAIDKLAKAIDAEEHKSEVLTELILLAERHATVVKTKDAEADQLESTLNEMQGDLCALCGQPLKRKR